MGTMQLNRMQPVSVRQIWPHEEKNFTPWLASNFEYLNDALDLNMEVIAVEETIHGAGRADIVARSNGGIAIIENQLESSDDDHFVRMLHYSAKQNAQCVIWVAHGFTDKHRDILAWLDKNSTISIYCVEVSAWRIGDGVGVMLRRVVPSDWVDAETLKDRNRRQQYRDYYRLLLERLAQSGLVIEDPDWDTDVCYRWFQTAHADVHYGLAHQDWDEKAWVFALINSDDHGQPTYQALLGFRSEIEEEMGVELVWEQEDNGDAWIGTSRIASPVDSGRADTAEQDWMYDSMMLLQTALNARLN